MACGADLPCSQKSKYDVGSPQNFTTYNIDQKPQQ